MTPQQHWEKADRIMRSLGKLGPADFEMIIEAAMLAGTHLLNAILHHEAITGPEADVLHAEYMTVALRTRTRLSLPGLVEALDDIENLRPFFVRGNIANGEAAAQRALQCLERLSAGRAAQGHDAA